MPFTFAHPAAVLPLRKLSPRFLNLPALIVGSLMPDLGYYVHNWVWSVSGHAFNGPLNFDMPAGFIALALFYLNIRPVARLLPYPHREACSEICPVLTMPTLRALLIAGVSLLLGAWSHIIWDGFTHENGWCVRHFAGITPTLFMLGGYRVTLWHILQHFSTAIGLLVLINAYCRYAYGKRFLKHKSLLGSKSSFAIWTFLLTLPAVRAVVSNTNYLSHGLSLPRVDEFVFNATVTYVCDFLPLMCAAGILVSILEYAFVSNHVQPAMIIAPALELEPVPLAAAAIRAPLLSVLSTSTDNVALQVESFSKQAPV
jgi:hypothetical protein